MQDKTLPRIFFCTFAPSLAKGMPCESATVPAAVCPRKVCQQATVRLIRMGRRQARASQKTCQTKSSIASLREQGRR